MVSESRAERRACCVVSEPQSGVFKNSKFEVQWIVMDSAKHFGLCSACRYSYILWQLWLMNRCTYKHTYTRTLDLNLS